MDPLNAPGPTPLFEAADEGGGRTGVGDVLEGALGGALNITPPIPLG